MLANRFLRTVQPRLSNLLQSNATSIESKRSVKRWLAPVRRVLKSRQKELDARLEPKKIFRRSAFIEWNYKAELYAFGARLNETFKEETLQTAFTHRSYIASEEEKRKSLGLPAEEITIELKDNQALINHGEVVLQDYIKSFLRIGYPFLPEEGIIALEKYLLSTDVLAHVASNLGVRELLLSADYPPQNATMANTFKAVVGALAKDSTKERSELFVQDFLITQLIGKNIIELWPIVNPMGIVVDVLNREGRGSPEARLIRETGRNTIFAVFQVGIYSDKNLIGVGAGETLDVAQDDAARDALKRFFEIGDGHPPLPFGVDGRKVKVQTYANLGLDEWTKEKVRNLHRSAINNRVTLNINQ